MAVDGRLLIAGERLATAAQFRPYAPALGAQVEPDFSIATAVEVARACALADAAFDDFRQTTPAQRAALLEAIARGLEAISAPLVERAALESGLPIARLTGECARTAAQLRLFAQVLRDGYWAGAVVDTAMPDRAPLPRPDLRMRRIAVGPVAVFGASNFPLAFSVAGGDTASALAAGCPVVVKGHPAHPGTSDMVGAVIASAAKACGMPAGVFSLLQGPGNDLGAALVADPHIKAVGFTGSRAGGLALLAVAQARPEPIPVYAEMASVNPVLLFPAALGARAEALGAGYVASLSQGAGQFCTNPGIVLGVGGAGFDRFLASAQAALTDVAPQVMLTAGIHHHYDTGVAALMAHTGVSLVAQGRAGDGCNQCRAALFQTDAATLRANPGLAQELFGAVSLVVRCAGVAEMGALVAAMEGQLTVTLQLDDGDVPLAAPLIPMLETKAGRLLANGWPTGVEVAHAVVHGGPYPATSDPRTTSVGSAAIERFLRPVCYQNFPESLLPPEIQPANPLGLPRLVDGSPRPQ